ncbi:MAG: molybdopterin molybdotransferase MoeA [Caenispirillum bisanense]|nr:molybdopterin molybdotransferase MoeA [Caenispirillum bisanense]MCA1971627.1 molybdopterin molybdotransferase MoeA [Caenispirillum sp.]
MSRDAFAPSADMLRADEAITRLLALVEPVAETERVALTDAYGRVLAEDVVSDRNVPPHDNSAVDGYAVRFADLSAEAETTLPVVMRIPAGHVPDRPLAPGEAARIFTGAPVPVEADTIIPQEPCREEADGRVVLPPVKKAGQNLRRAGEDIVAGQCILGAGTRLRPQEVGYMASVGCARPLVYRTVRAAVFSTGDEVRDPGADAPPGAIYDSNRYVLIGLLRDMGCTVRDFGILPDDPARLRAVLQEAAAEADVVLTSGGVSTGEEDHVKAVLGELGTLDFWRVAIRPGRPLALGRVGQAAFIGLPGNPVAVFVTFMMFARPLILKRMGLREVLPRPVPVRAGFAFKKRPGRREWLRATLEPGEDGLPVAQRFPSEGSGILRSVVTSHGLLALPEDPAEITPGMVLDFLPFEELKR